ncbi:Anaphase-promoting complex subunit 8 [Microbotryomycetes sp. JL201]|nr:Anaphase-promoting complex subunit 8 [Microbotryomycetes sp. JL201]
MSAVNLDTHTYTLSTELGALSFELDVVRQELRDAVRDCMDRGLNASARWCAELQVALVRHNPAVEEPSTRRTTTFKTSTPVRHSSGHAHPETAGTTAPSGRQSLLPGLPPMSSASHAHGRESLGSILEIGSSPAGHPSVIEEQDSLMDHDWHNSASATDNPAATSTPSAPDKARQYKHVDRDEEAEYLLALSYLRMHEHLRCGHALRNCVGPRARFLRCYSRYLAGEKRSQEDDGQLLGATDKNNPNPYALEVLEDMYTWQEWDWYEDGWWLYLKSLLLLSLPSNSPPPSFMLVQDADVRLTAMDALIKSVTLEPWNWSAWLKLASCIDGPDELETVIQHLPDTIPFRFFFVHATLEIHAAGDNLHDVVNELGRVFHDCSMLNGMRALIHYHVREFDEATEYFELLQKTDPYRIEEIDVYSNILYVSEKRAELAALAQEYVKVDRSRPEVCCLIGNYYSLRREHEKAIVYFRRALKLDRSYLSAWTLMGHEYVEIKNTNAAIASYRRAVDVNRKDYRAWYGLGQTYELLGEPFFALTYYQQATSLRPFDTRMWTALAICYEKLKRIPDAIKAYQRALVSSDVGESDTALRIGRLYSLIGESEKAAQYHKRALYEGLKTDATRQELSKIWIWLARHECEKEKRGEPDANLRLAEEYLNEAKTVHEDKEEAEGLLKTLSLLMLNRE